MKITAGDNGTEYLAHLGPRFGSRMFDMSLDKVAAPPASSGSYQKGACFGESERLLWPARVGITLRVADEFSA